MTPSVLYKKRDLKIHLEKYLTLFKIPHIKVDERKKDKNIWYQLIINSGGGAKDWTKGKRSEKTGLFKEDSSRINKSNLIRFYQFIFEKTFI